MRRELREQTGSVAVEFAVLAPAMLVFVLLVGFAGRVSQAEADVARAAGEAARAASLRQHPATAAAAAGEVAAANLAESGVACASFDTHVDTSDFGPGGVVTVRVRCTASMADVARLGVPGERVFDASSTEPIDRFRSGPGVRRGPR